MPTIIWVAIRWCWLLSGLIYVAKGYQIEVAVAFITNILVVTVTRDLGVRFVMMRFSRRGDGVRGAGDGWVRGPEMLYFRCSRRDNQKIEIAFHCPGDVVNNLIWCCSFSGFNIILLYMCASTLALASFMVQNDGKWSRLYYVKCIEQHPPVTLSCRILLAIYIYGKTGGNNLIWTEIKR